MSVSCAVFAVGIICAADDWIFWYMYRAGSLNHLAMPLPLPMLLLIPLPVLPIKRGSLNHFKTPKETLEDHCCHQADGCFPDHLWKHYLKIAILWVASAVASQIDLNIQLRIEVTLVWLLTQVCILSRLLTHIHTITGQA